METAEKKKMKYFELEYEAENKKAGLIDFGGYGVYAENLYEAIKKVRIMIERDIAQDDEKPEGFIITYIGY